MTMAILPLVSPGDGGDAFGVIGRVVALTSNGQHRIAAGAEAATRSATRSAAPFPSILRKEELLSSCRRRCLVESGREDDLGVTIACGSVSGTGRLLILADLFN